MKSHHSSYRSARSRAFVLVATLLFMLALAAAPASAAEIEVGGDCTLAEAIANANNDNNGGGTGNGCAAGDGDDTIKLTGDVNLGGSTLTITKTLTIEGADHTLKGTGNLLEVRALPNADSTVTP